MDSLKSNIPDFYSHSDPLSAFLDWFISSSPKFGMIPLHNAVQKIDGVTSVLWFRHNSFQVQLFIVPPNYIIPEHVHPNVDSFEVYLGGQAKFSLNGKWEIHDSEMINPTIDGISHVRTQSIRVLPSSPHGGTFGPSGGVFLSVQHWLNNVAPHCVSSDYTGKVMGPQHYNGVTFGKAINSEQRKLDFTDAASFEKKGAYWDFNEKAAKQSKGFVDDIGTESVRGWAISNLDKSTPQIIEVRYKNKVVGVGLSNSYRKDIDDLFEGTKGIAGYKINIESTEVIGDLNPNLVEVYCNGKKLPFSNELKARLKR